MTTIGRDGRDARERSGYDSAVASDSVRSSKQDDLPIVEVACTDQWDDWLADRHATSAGVWLKIAKQGSGITTPSYGEAVEIAVMYGWIDGQKGRLDDDYWLQRFTPRRPGSKWSEINRTRAAALIERGAMKPAGLREVERARADGRWEAAYPGQRTATVPADLAAALEADPRARAFFETLSGANRYAILFRIHEAKQPQTRARRIEKYVAMCAEQKTLHP
jgi:uncharacterized protein YdeI (YjbR/CyaY-like superfamily)